LHDLTPPLSTSGEGGKVKMGERIELSLWNLSAAIGHLRMEICEFQATANSLAAFHREEEGGEVVGV